MNLGCRDMGIKVLRPAHHHRLHLTQQLPILSCHLQMIMDAAHGDTPVCYHMVEDLVGGEEPVHGLAPCNLDSELHLASTGEPCSFAEAERSKAWQAAMREEIEVVERNKTWELVDLPHGHQPIGLKWVYKLKKNEAGEVMKHKAWLVACSFVEQAGVDFDEVLAPVARIESIRLLLALAAGGVARPPHGRKISFSQRRTEGGSLCEAATRFHCQR